MKAVNLEGSTYDGMMDKLMDTQVNITGAQIVHVEKRADGKVLWVNVNGICVLRVCNIGKLTVKV